MRSGGTKRIPTKNSRPESDTRRELHREGAGVLLGKGGVELW